MLCGSVDFAAKYGFPQLRSFIKGGAYNPNEWHDGHGGVDLDSIMIYDSERASVPRCQEGDYLAFCPIIMWWKAKDGSMIEGKIQLNRRPSQKDVGFIKRFYPFPAQ
jgi:hypothetical protein